MRNYIPPTPEEKAELKAQQHKGKASSSNSIKQLFNLGEDLITELGTIADRQGRYKSDVFREALRHYIDRYWEQEARTLRNKKELGLLQEETT